MKSIYAVTLRDCRARTDEDGLFPFGSGGQSILVVARSFTEAIEETQKRYGPRYEVVGIQMTDQRTHGPRDIIV